MKKYNAAYGYGGISLYEHTSWGILVDTRSVKGYAIIQLRDRRDSIRVDVDGVTITTIPLNENNEQHIKNRVRSRVRRLIEDCVWMIAHDKELNLTKLLRDHIKQMLDVENIRTCK